MQMLQQMRAAATTTSQTSADSSDDASASSDISKLFSSIDTDGDGQISQVEFSSFADQFTSSTAATLISAQETSSTSSSETSDIAALFESVDEDGDGEISETELSNAVASAPPPPPPSESVESEETASGESAAAGGGGAQTYDPLDTNMDGTVSSAERMAALAPQPSALSNKLSASVMSSLLDTIGVAA
jgi:Ca2+-binding EF-hand superfamily protein